MFRGKVVIKKAPVDEVAVNGELLCGYPHRVCMQTRLEGYDYCIKHILEDKTAPYKQCSYMCPKNGKRCPNAVSKLDRRDGYCQEHSRKATFMRQQSLRKRRPVETPISLLEDLSHYSIAEDFMDFRVHLSKDISPSTLAKMPLNAPVNRISKIIEYNSDSDSDVEPVNVDQTWKGNADSDAESVDSEMDDLLKHAGVYTAEEVTIITRDKLTKLQSLYIEQFKRLQHLIREKRRKFLLASKQEKDLIGSIPAHSNVSPKEVDRYRKLKALLRYHRLHGVELLLHHQSKERRKAATDGIKYKPPTYTKCCYPEKDKKCGQRALPFSKYCTKHILNDHNQVLFQPCAFRNTSCKNPILSLANMNACIFHCPIPPIPTIPTRDPVQQEQQHSENPTINDQMDPLAQSAEEMCGLQSSDFVPVPPSDMQCTLYGDSNSGGSELGGGLSTTEQSKQLWGGLDLAGTESKLRDIDLAPIGDLPPEQLLATN